MVEFDGEHDAVFVTYNNEGRPFGEYTEDRGEYTGLPLDDIKRVFKEKYPIYSKQSEGFSILPVKNEAKKHN